MNDLFWNSSLGSATGEIYIPKGLGPFPGIIMFDTGSIKSTKTYATFYAEKMKEIGFLSFLVSLNLNQSRANSNMRCDSLKSLMIINKLSKFL